MKNMVLLALILLMTGCGVSKSTHGKVLESMQRLTQERDAVNVKLKNLTAQLDETKKELETTLASREALDQELMKTKEDLKQCKDDVESLRAKAAKVEMLEEALNIIKNKLKDIRTRSRGLLEDITEISE
ncbi:MAG: hypothetical protein RQ824_02380 [bacterium]|nr:hypothetical protein [bacterium]